MASCFDTERPSQSGAYTVAGKLTAVCTLQDGPSGLPNVPGIRDEYSS